MTKIINATGVLHTVVTILIDSGILKNNNSTKENINLSKLEQKYNDIKHKLSELLTTMETDILLTFLLPADQEKLHNTVREQITSIKESLAKSPNKQYSKYYAQCNLAGYRFLCDTVRKYCWTLDNRIMPDLADINKFLQELETPLRTEQSSTAKQHRHNSIHHMHNA